jgi:hypothetical protein
MPVKSRLFFFGSGNLLVGTVLLRVKIHQRGGGGGRVLMKGNYCTA